MDASQRLLRLDDVVARVGFRRAALYGWIRKGVFPAPVKIGRCSLWPESVIDKWISDRIAESK